jgi:hypothetical protein
MLGFKSTATARVILGGIEMIHMMRKQQAKYAGIRSLHSRSRLTCSPHNRASKRLSHLRLLSRFATQPRLSEIAIAAGGSGMAPSTDNLALVSVATAGAYNIGFALFHLLFWRLFYWPATLRSSGALNSAVTQTLNLMLIYCFLVYGGWLLSVSVNGTQPSLLLLLAGAGFWTLRTALQPVLIGLRSKLSVGFPIAFGTGTVLHLVAALLDTR